MADYVGPAKIRMNGRPLVQTESCRISRQGNHKPVKTLALGLAGKTKGSGEVMIDLTQAIPANGREAQWKELVLSGDTVEIDVEAANETETFEGWFETADTNHEVDTTTVDSAKFHGRRKSVR